MQITAKEIIPVIKLLPDSALYNLLVAQAQVIGGEHAALQSGTSSLSPSCSAGTGNSDAGQS